MSSFIFSHCNVTKRVTEKNLGSSTTLCNPPRPSATLYDPLRPSTTLCNPLQPSTTLYNPLQPSMILCDPLQPSMILCNPLRPSTTRYDIACKIYREKEREPSENNSNLQNYPCRPL